MIAASLVEDATNELFEQLRGFGAQISYATKRPPLKRLDSRLFGLEDQRFIDVDDSPIQWINVVVWVPRLATKDWSFYIRYGIPDSRLVTKSLKVNVSLILSRSFPHFGKITGLQWKGNDSGLGIIQHLNSDLQIKEAILMDLGDWSPPFWVENPLWILARPSPEAYWLIVTPYYYPGRRGFPSRELWYCYQKIAGQLLLTPIHQSGAM